MVFRSSEKAASVIPIRVQRRLLFERRLLLLRGVIASFRSGYMFQQQSNDICADLTFPLKKKNRTKMSPLKNPPPLSPRRSPRKLIASVYKAATPSSAYPWHKDIAAALQSSKWQTVRANIAQINQQSNNSWTSNNSSDNSFEKKGRASSFWNRISGLRGGGGTNGDVRDKTGLLSQDDEQRTPLHWMVSSRKSPVEVVLQILQTEPRAAATPNHRGRLPLHFAVVHRQDISVIAALIEAYPAAISFPDSKGQSPLQYAVDIAKRESLRKIMPRTFWMPLPDDCEEAVWQDGQSERWGIVHWLLLSSATHPQTSLSVGGRKPMLVEALLAAASPAVISLLIGASVMLLSYENKASAFAGSTLYTCITRHYPLTILKSLASQCPPDVYKIRDETGMGLVSAQFIAGCFEQIPATQEWTVSEDFYACLIECMQEGDIGDDPAVTDWWQKIEFLIAVCACGKQNRRFCKSGANQQFDASNFPKEFLLHAALLNNDTSPSIIRMLLALYPKSIRLPYPSTKALPLHMVAMKREYIPRNYEVHTTGNESAVEIILEANRSAVRERHEGRLPLHYAIAAGGVIETLNPLLAAATSNDDDDVDDHPHLLQIDPKTGLYPFLLAAAYPNNSDEDSFRWTCAARNKYSHAVWQGLPDRKKASAVLKVAESDDIARIDTIYELLRRQPEAICDVSQRQRPIAKGSTGSRDSINLCRDSTGKGVVAAHYFSWCFKEKVDKFRGSLWEPNVAQQDVLRQAIEVASMSGDFSRLSSEFDVWWSKLLFFIRYACRKGIRPIQAQHDDFVCIKIPLETNKYLLHAALSNSDTPPEVIEILLAMDSEATSLAISGSYLLPLHIAARTPSYIPRSLERYEHSSIDLLLKVYPRAARVLVKGRLPLHIAIAARKSSRDIVSLVREEPRAVAVVDPSTGFYPFQLMATRHEYTPELRLQFQYLARNRFDEIAWKDQTPQARTKQFQRVQKEYELDVLSSLFFLLRSDPSRIERPSLIKDDDSEAKSAMTGYLSSAITTITSARKASDVSSGDDSTFCAQSKKPEMPRATAQTPSSLMLLLSQHRSKHSKKNEGIFDCDASVFSNVDVMSTLTSTIHSSRKSEIKTIPVTDGSPDDGSINIYSVAVGEAVPSSGSDTSYDDFAEDSDVRGSSTQASDDEDSAASTESGVVEDINTESDGESVASFEIRKVPRFSSGKMRDGDAPRASVRLIKKPPQSLLAEIKAHSLSSRVASVKTQSGLSISSKAIDKNSVQSRFSYSYKSLRSEEIARMNRPAEMMWMTPSLLNTEISGQADVADTNNEHSSVSLSLSSQHSNVKPGGKNIGSAKLVGRQAPSKSTSPSSRSSSIRPESRSSSRSQSSHSKGRAHSSAMALSMSQASLLGSYGDTDADTVEEDPMLNMDAEPLMPNALRSVSEHFKSSTLVPTFRSSHEKSGSNGRSTSDVATKTTRPGPSVDHDGFGIISADDDLSSKPGALNTSGLISRPDVYASAEGILEGIHSAVAALNEDNLDDEAPEISNYIVKRNPMNLISGVYALENGKRDACREPVSDDSMTTDWHDQGRLSIDVCATHLNTTNNPRIVPITALVSTKYFDKASMSWKERPTDLEGTTRVDRVAILPPLDGEAMKLKPAMYFDKQSMRWVAIDKVSKHSQRDDGGGRVEGEPLPPRRTMPVDLRSSKASQISKTERHQAIANKGRSQFLGRSRTVTTKCARTKSGQLTSMPSSSLSPLTCLICNVNEREILLVPCRHLCICRVCSVQQTSLTNCPLCAERVTSKMRIFLA